MTATYWPARARVMEFLRQFTRQTRPIDTTVVHTVHTDPEAEVAPLLTADLQAVLNGPPRDYSGELTAHWGTCSDQKCLTNMVIYPHRDRGGDLPDEEEWEDSLHYVDCPVCGSSMDWGGTDHPADVIINY